jgi:hypothetical protein
MKIAGVKGRFMAPSGYGGAIRCFQVYIQVQIRRGGFLPGAAEFIVIGGMGVSTPIVLPERIRFSWEITGT